MKECSTCSVQRINADAFLQELWEDIGTGARGSESDPAIAALQAAGVLSARDAELWKLRIKSVCPGHNGGQSWCAYCGTLYREHMSENSAGLHCFCCARKPVHQEPIERWAGKRYGDRLVSRCPACAIEFPETPPV